MKNLILVFTALIIFAGCEKPTAECIEITDPNIQVDDDCITSDELDEFDYRFEIAQTQERSDGQIFVDSTNIMISVFSYPVDNYWKIEFTSLLGSNSQGSVFYTYDGTGDFDFNLVHTWLNGTQDTIYGSGYFDLDTFYVNYEYIKLTDETVYGSVNMHSY